MSKRKGPRKSWGALAADPALRRLLPCLRPHAAELAAAALFLSGTAACSFLTATLLGRLTDLSFYSSGDWSAAAPLALIAVTLLFSLCTLASSALLSRVTQKILRDMRGRLFSRLLHWPEETAARWSSGVIASRFVNEANLALSGSIGAFTVLVRDSLQVASLLAVLFWQNWRLTLISFVIGPVLAAALRIISRRMKRSVKQSQQMVAEMISRVEETYAAWQTVKLAEAYDFESKRFGRANHEAFRAAVDTLRMKALGTPVSQLITMAGVAVVVAAALLLAQGGQFSFGEFVTFLTALLLLKTPVQNLSGLNATFTAISAAAGNVFEMLDEPLERDEGKKTPGALPGRIAFEGVSLVYPGADKPALTNVNLEIAPGETIAVVGESGSGKSSLASLLPRFRDPTEGRVTMDGVDLRDYSLSALRSSIAYVSQEVVLLEGTIRDNIAYSKPGAADEEVSRAADAAGLRPLLSRLPKGLDTPVGEAGKKLSGGQRQLISIARALLKDAPVLILDEATSALDPRTEAALREALCRLMQDRTCLVIAHRLSMAAGADRVVVLEKGRIAEEGRPEKLLRREGSLFRKLAKAAAF